jgi:hypothetical protein
MDAGGIGNGATSGPNVERMRGRQSSMAIPGRRDRSPGATMAGLSDLAHQGEVFDMTNLTRWLIIRRKTAA